MKVALAVAAVFAFAMTGARTSAHHSFSLEYDSNKPIKLEGVVSKIEWTNPHARVYIEVPGASGTVHTWNLELASLSALQRNGWTSRSLKAGDRVKVEGFEGRAVNSYRANATSIVLPDGRALFSGPAGGDR
jgi:hypothetical protein